MKKAVLVVMFCAIAGVTHAEPFFVAGEDPKPSGSVWMKVDGLSDEFDGTTLDTTKWQSEPIGNGWN
jgi:beta-porphyranase